jgi:hypothetical protein
MFGLGPEDALGPLVDDSGSDPAALEALRRLLAEVTLVAEAMDGLLIGYWLPPKASETVLVGIDDHGQVSVLGRTFAEALIGLTDPDEPDEAAEVVAELRALGIEPLAETVQAVLGRIESIPEPNEVVLGYLLEVKLDPPAV